MTFEKFTIINLTDGSGKKYSDSLYEIYFGDTYVDIFRKINESSPAMLREECRRFNDYGCFASRDQYGNKSCDLCENEILLMSKRIPISSIVEIKEMIMGYPDDEDEEDGHSEG